MAMPYSASTTTHSTPVFTGPTFSMGTDDPNHEGPVSDEHIESQLAAWQAARLKSRGSVHSLLDKHAIPLIGTASNHSPLAAIPPDAPSPLIEPAAVEAPIDGTERAAVTARLLPLGNIHRVTATKQAPVILTDGQYAAKALDDYIAHACAIYFDPDDGLSNYDLSPLAGKAVLIWLREGDGRRDQAADLVQRAGAAQVSVVNRAMVETLIGGSIPKDYGPTNIAFDEGLVDWLLENDASQPDCGLWEPWVGPSSLPLLAPSSSGTALVPALATIMEWSPDATLIDSPLVPAWDYPETVRIIVKTLFTVLGESRIRFFGDTIYIWTGQRWKEKSREYLYHWLYRFCDKALVETAKGSTVTVRPYQPNKFKIDNLLTAMMALYFLDIDQVPDWSDAKTNPSRPKPSDVIALANGLLLVDAWLTNPAVALMGHTPLWFSLNHVPYADDRRRVVSMVRPEGQPA